MASAASSCWRSKNNKKPANKERTPTRRGCWCGPSSSEDARQQPWLLWLFFCWSISTSINIPSSYSHSVEALVPPPFPHRRHRHHDELSWGVTVRGGAGGGGGAPVEEESSDADCHSSGDNTSSSSLQEELLRLSLDFPRWDDVSTAMAAVRKACAVTVALQPLHEQDAAAATGLEMMTKDDESPVTVADLAVQAVVLHHLSLQQHPQQQPQQQQQPSKNNAAIGIMDGFIAEEDSTKLRSSPALCQRVADAAQLTTSQVLQAIDAGQSHLQWTTTTNSSSQQSSKRRPRRVWCLDPIDGTRGFLRGRRTGGQYAVALALLEDGVPVVGVLGCPNLPHNDTTNLAWSDAETDESSSAHRGCLFVASRGGGCYQLAVPSAPAGSAFVAPATTATTHVKPRRLHVTSTGSIREGRFCIGVESYSDAQGQTVKMARLLHGPDGVRNDNHTIVRARRMDSQAKHGIVARGGAEWYVRLPRPGYVEWIWDHAAGFVVATEAGGTVTDTAGRPLDFSRGAQLSPDVHGVLMSCGGPWHDALVQAYAAVVQEDATTATTADGDRP